LLGELTALPLTPSWCGGGSLLLPKNSSPLSAFGLELWPSASVVLPKDMGSVSNRNFCKRFRFTEKVEKHWCRHCYVSDTGF